MNAADPVAGVLETLRDHAEHADRDAAFPAASVRVLRESGLMGYLVPTEYGGLGGDVHGFADTARSLGGACLSTAAVWAMHTFQVDALVHWAEPVLRDRVLPEIASGRLYLASVTTEAGRGADLFTARAPVLTEGDLLKFERRAPVVTGGRHAEGFLITLRAGQDAAEQEVSLVYADRADLQITERGTWDPLGMRGTESVGLDLSGTVPAHHLVGTPGKFREIAWQSMVPLAHIGWSACWLGAASGAYGDVLRWLRDPQRRGGPELRSELLRDRLGRLRVDLDLVSAYLAKVCDHVMQAREEGGSLAGPQTQLRVNSLKLAASELTFKVADELVQLAGMNGGYARNAPLALERRFRDLRSARLNHSNDRLWPATGALALLDPSVSLF